MGGLILEQERSAIIGAAIEVHKILGPGFLEAVYQEALGLELAERGIPFEPQKPLKMRFKQWTLKKEYVPDFLCFGSVVVEIKAMKALTSQEQAIALNYLRASGFRVCILINFGSHGKLEFQPIVL
ncbi:MAG: GxxExxY protein [Planctomycetes bacterium]|nr:GxxExxY protein [Planctomycetota bacterium]MCW8134130.1 GxxExxY protein [Planctomycetota bacterium]